MKTPSPSSEISRYRWQKVKSGTTFTNSNGWAVIIGCDVGGTITVSDQDSDVIDKWSLVNPLGTNLTILELTHRMLIPEKGSISSAANLSLIICKNLEDAVALL